LAQDRDEHFGSQAGMPVPRVKRASSRKTADAGLGAGAVGSNEAGASLSIV